MTPNAETLVETYDSKTDKKQPIGTKLTLIPVLLDSFIERGIVKKLEIEAKPEAKELKPKATTKELKVKDVETKTE